MVIGLAKNPLNRRLFEDEFVLQLKARGTEAIASYTVLPDKQQDDGGDCCKGERTGSRYRARHKTGKQENCASLCTGNRLLPSALLQHMAGLLRLWLPVHYSPGYIAENEYAVIETNLYETRNDQLVWAASSETLISDSDKNLIKSYIGIMVDTLVEQGLLGK